MLLWFLLLIFKTDPVSQRKMSWWRGLPTAMVTWPHFIEKVGSDGDSGPALLWLLEMKNFECLHHTSDGFCLAYIIVKKNQLTL